MSKWTKARLGDCCEITSSKRIFYSDYVKSGVPFYRSKEIIESFEGVRNFSETLYITEERYNEIRSRFGVPAEGDLLLTSVGTIGVPYLVKQGDRFYFKDGNLTWFRNFKKTLDSKFLFYWLQTNQGKGELDAHTIGSSQKALTIRGLKEVSIRLPDIEQQQRMISILSDYDSAIDNARRQIALLEEAAMRLYREWFGDGKGKKMPLGEFVEITTSGSWGTDAKTAKTPNEVVCIRGADFEEIHGRSLGKQIRRFISDKHLAERGLKDGDLVVEMSGGSPTQSTGRVVSISDMLLARYGVPVLATNFCKVVRPKSGYSHFLYLAWRDLYVSRIMFNYEVGTTGIKNFDYDLFVSDVEVTNPLPKLTQFNGLVDGMFSSIDMLGSLVQDLTEARDRLLPKLMSGEIEV